MKMKNKNSEGEYMTVGNNVKHVLSFTVMYNNTYVRT
jgi:hypothetical protein